MFYRVYSGDICGIDTYQISIEADVSGGLPGFTMVGLPSSEVREARERVERAIANSGFDFPARKVTINLSPAYIRKQGSGFDLPIAVAMLAAMGAIRPEALEGKMFTGELSLDGRINPVKGVLPLTAFARDRGFDCIVVPKANENEGSCIDGIRIHGALTLKSLIKELNKNEIHDVRHQDVEVLLANAVNDSVLDYSQIVGQEAAKKATMVAVSGFHNILYIGPPGAGKSMLAQRIPTILSRMTREECIEVSKIYSVAGMLKDGAVLTERPFRAPHQTITSAALIGGTSEIKPGEITLAHNGVLFLDELAEFNRNLIDELRTPIEQKEIVITRANHKTVMPCCFIMAAATNPCKCGYYPDRRYCHCTDAEAARYINKIKGPIMDRIDICVGVSRIRAESFGEYKNENCLNSEMMRSKVEMARQIQLERFAGENIIFNSQMDKQLIDKYCLLDSKSREILENAYDKLHMTARGWYKVLKVSRTIADLDGGRDIGKKHVLEAISYRNKL